jgi:predicted RNA-binding protein associated with RNAse of E/G family
MRDSLHRASWNGTWQPDEASVEAFRLFQPGSTITVAKWAPDGTEVASYPAAVVATAAPAPWIELVARWTLPRVVVSGLVFEPGDTLHEFFSAEHPFNAFAVFSPEGLFRGWYGNVTYPAFLGATGDETLLVWHDLYLDVVILPDGSMQLLDDDELAESGLSAAQPAFASAIEQARLDLIEVIPTLMRT